MKYGVQLYSLRNMIESKGLEETIKTVAVSGYQGVEFAGFYNYSSYEIKAMLEKYGLTAVSAHIQAEDVEEYFEYVRVLNIKNVWCFNMDEWADGEGNTMTGEASFQSAMEQAFYNTLGKLTVPESHRNFALKDNLPTYPEKIEKLKKEGAKLVLVYGIGRMCHIAFWEPTIGAEFKSEAEWKRQPYRVAVQLHPLTIEQNAITSFKSRTSLVPCRANTIGPGLFLQADYAIGGADGAFNRGMQWQGMSFWMTLRYGPSRHVTSSYIPTLPGKLFFVKELAGPLVPEVN